MTMPIIVNLDVMMAKDASLATYWSIVPGLTIWRQKNNNKQ